jgi:serine/threonine-protein kinase
LNEQPLDRYRLEAELGHGGMSVVHRARDTKLPRAVAVKVLHEFLARQEEGRRRFHREAVAVARLEHRAIVAIYDYSGPDADQSFIVTELIEGPTLRDYINRHGPFPWPEMAMLVVSELAEALAHAHDAGVVHRDIKPENIMIQRGGQLKLMDFGIAEIVGGATRLTSTGALIGSPAHMAPEVIDGKPADHRADLFSLGTILFLLTTGQLPFEGPHPSALFRRILAGDYPPPESLNPKIGRQLSRILDRCLAPDPDQRFATAHQLLEALKDELTLVAMTPPEPLARALFEDRDSFMAQRRDPMLRSLLDAGMAAFEARSWGRAGDLFNRILAHQPDHPEATAFLQRIARGRRRRSQTRWAAGAAVAAVLALAGLGWALQPPPRSAPERAAVADRPAPLPVEEGPLVGPRPPPEPEPSLAAARPVRRARRPRPPAVAEAPAVRTPVVIQIGRGYADVYVNGELAADLTFKGRVELSPGLHTVEVVRDRRKILRRLGLDAPPTDREFPLFGRFAPRQLEVTEDGSLFELTARGRTPVPSGILRFLIPMTEDEAQRNEGWTSS